MPAQPRSRSIFATAFVLSVAAVICAFIYSMAWVRTHTRDEVIHVTGSAQQPIRSDLAIWDGTVTEEAATMDAAYKALEISDAKVNSYLVDKGVAPAEITTSSITTKTLYVRAKGDDTTDDSSSDTGTFRPIKGYRLIETFEVRSQNVDLVDTLSRKSTELISSGVPFESQAPEYLYTKLGDLKVEMLAAAAKDARGRGEQIAHAAGCRLGDVRAAHMGVLQIEPLYNVGSNKDEISDTGSNDTSSLDKKIIAVVTTDYAIH